MKSKPRYIAHIGGKRPVRFEEVVETVLRNGEFYTAIAINVDWKHDGIGLDVIAYRVLSDE